MAVTARPLPRSRPAAGAPARPRAAASRSARGKAAHPGASTRDKIGIVLIAAAILVLAVVGIAVIWEFGAARTLSVPRTGMIGAEDGTGPSVQRPRDAPTMLYRDMRDGRIMVMEVGPDGTRLKGTVDKSTVPLANDTHREPTSSRSAEPSATDRVNALGSAFR